jgi:hypothetical protein
VIEAERAQLRRVAREEALTAILDHGIGATIAIRHRPGISSTYSRAAITLPVTTLIDISGQRNSMRIGTKAFVKSAIHSIGTIYSSGDSHDPMALYTAFRGCEPTIEALLRRWGPTLSLKRLGHQVRRVREVSGRQEAIARRTGLCGKVRQVQTGSQKYRKISSTHEQRSSLIDFCTAKTLGLVPMGTRAQTDELPCLELTVRLVTCVPPKIATN